MCLNSSSGGRHLSIEKISIKNSHFLKIYFFKFIYKYDYYDMEVGHLYGCNGFENRPLLVGSILVRSLILLGWDSHGVIVNVLDYSLKVSEFKLQSCY